MLETATNSSALIQISESWRQHLCFCFEKLGKPEQQKPKPEQLPILLTEAQFLCLFALQCHTKNKKHWKWEMSFCRTKNWRIQKCRDEFKICIPEETKNKNNQEQTKKKENDFQNDSCQVQYCHGIQLCGVAENTGTSGNKHPRVMKDPWKFNGTWLKNEAFNTAKETNEKIQKNSDSGCWNWNMIHSHLWTKACEMWKSNGWTKKQAMECISGLGTSQNEESCTFELCPCPNCQRWSLRVRMNARGHERLENILMKLVFFTNGNWSLHFCHFRA